MKLSMWMIEARLQKYSPKYDIMDGDARISGVRFYAGEDVEFEEQYVYLMLNTKDFPKSQAPEEAVLVNGRDIIILQSTNVNNILNDLLAVFDYYNTWEAALWAESAHKSFQRILDLGDPVLENPMMLSDVEGNVLAMSSAYRDEDINEYWMEARDTKHVPTVILGSPVRGPGGETARSWTNEPKEYLMPDGTNTIGASLTADGENVAGFSLWEYRKPINPGDVGLVKILCTILTSMIGEKKRGAELRSSSAIIEDLLAGVEIDAELIGKLALKCPKPWRLVVIDNPFRNDIFYMRSMVSHLRKHALPCVPLIYGDQVVTLVSDENAVPLIDSVLGAREKQYYMAGLSLPFDDLLNIVVRYEQTVFALKRAGGKPGLYQSEDCAFDYLLSLMGDKSRKQALTHPILTKLRRHDAENRTELYDTLYQYLLHEGSILLGSQALHIHRNSFMYRLQRIKKLLEVNLDDPILRVYLLISFMLEKTK